MSCGADIVGRMLTSNVRVMAPICNCATKKEPEGSFLLIARRGPLKLRVWLADERLFDHVVTRRIVAAFLEAEVIKQLARVAQHVRAAAQHHAVVFEREARHA